MVILSNNRLSAIIVDTDILYPGTNVVEDDFEEKNKSRIKILLKSGTIDFVKNFNSLATYKQISLCMNINSLKVADKFGDIVKHKDVKEALENRKKDLRKFISEIERMNSSKD